MILKFNEDRRFRILQLTDIHLGTYPFSEKDQKSLSKMKEAVEATQPDLLIFTGDIIYSLDNHGAKNPIESFTQFVKYINQFEIPTAITFGNHDTEDKVSRAELRSIFNRYAKYPAEKKHSDIVKDRESYILEIQHSSREEVERVLCVIDSGDYPDQLISYYAWVLPEQVSWFRETIKFYRKGDGIKRHIVFQHIPLPEHWNAADFIAKGNFHEDFSMNLKWAESSGFDLSESIKKKLKNIKYGVSSPELNSGLFLEMINDGEIWGMFVGHDHDNNYEGLYKGVTLAFGQNSGYNSYGTEAKGAKIIDLLENENVETDVYFYDKEY